jgi:hypothetical protein
MSTAVGRPEEIGNFLFEEFLMVGITPETLGKADATHPENHRMRLAPQILARFPNVVQGDARIESVPGYAFPRGVLINKLKISKSCAELNEFRLTRLP